MNLISRSCHCFWRGTNRIKSELRQIRFISGTSQEIRIPVPYGHIAGKSWGDPDGKPILALHGWLDNCASFDGLAERLPEGHRLLSIDMAGHGLSSHFPAGMQYGLSDAFSFIRIVLDHLKLDSAILMGHSMGGAVALWYTSMFPEQVEKLIQLDIISYGTLELDKHVKASRRSVQEAVKVQSKLNNTVSLPSYSFEDACERAFMATNHFLGMGTVTKESVEKLLCRGLVKVGEDRYTWSADLRLRVPPTFSMVHEATEEYTKQVTCPHLLVKATDSMKFMSDTNYDKLLAILRSSPQFKYEEVTGGHHVHLNNPDLVSPLVNQFLLSEYQL